MYRCAPIKQARWIRYLSDWEGSKKRSSQYSWNVSEANCWEAGGRRKWPTLSWGWTAGSRGAGETGGARWAWDCWDGMEPRGWRGASISLIGGVSGHHPMLVTIPCSILVQAQTPHGTTTGHEPRLCPLDEGEEPPPGWPINPFCPWRGTSAQAEGGRSKIKWTWPPGKGPKKTRQRAKEKNR